VEELEVELPETLIQQEVRNLIEQTAGQISQQGMDVKKLFTPDLVRSLMDTSRPEAEQRLRRTLALKALAAAEKIEVAAADLEAKLTEIRQGLSDSAAIDQERLRLAVAEDLLKEKLLEWLEANSTITDKAPVAEESSDPSDSTGESATEKQPKATKAAAKSKKGATGAGGSKAQEEGTQP
jgi:trigger factor